ncbi:MAG: HAMP domain-containing sensor histidine kinase [Planctomycetales bacterium]
MIRRSSLKWPILLGVVLLVLIIALSVFWIVGQAMHGQWGLLTIGTVFFVLILIGVILYFILTLKEIRLTRRQANFIDSVSHELKSPIASIKLYLQTMELRDVGEEQRREFHHFMMADIERLDSLIDHLLATAKLDHGQRDEPVEDVPLTPLLQSIIGAIQRRYQLEPEQIKLSSSDLVCIGNLRDLEMIFSNLLDNAAKYAGTPAKIEVVAEFRSPGTVLVRIADNGQGVGFELRRKIFQRFERGGLELERTTTGTGLGLYLVKSLVKKLKGRIHVHGRGILKGATFEVELPGSLNSTPAVVDPAEAQPRP